MRYITMIISLSLILVMHSSAAADSNDELIQLTDLAADHELEIDEWNVTVKEDMNKDVAKRTLNELKSERDVKVSGHEKEKAMTYTINHSDRGTHINETYRVVIPKNNHHQASLTATLKSERWDETTAANYRKHLDRVESYFTKESTTFACITADINAKIKDVYIINELKQSLQLEHMKVQQDNVEESSVSKIVYGYTPQWGQAITMEQPSNVQMVIHEGEKNRKQLTIGTPILIHEY